MKWWCARSRRAKSRVNELEGMLEEQRKQIESQDEKIQKLKAELNGAVGTEDHDNVGGVD